MYAALSNAWDVMPVTPPDIDSASPAPEDEGPEPPA
jgi:hypothetical protein